MTMSRSHNQSHAISPRLSLRIGCHILKQFPSSQSRPAVQSIQLSLQRLGGFWLQRKGMETVLARNMEMSQTITDYQRRLRDSAQKLQASEDLSRRRSIEVYILYFSLHPRFAKL